MLKEVRLSVPERKLLFDILSKITTGNISVSRMVKETYSCFSLRQVENDIVKVLSGKSATWNSLLDCDEKDVYTIDENTLRWLRELVAETDICRDGENTSKVPVAVHIIFANLEQSLGDALLAH